MSVMVIESFEGNLYANILDQLFALEEIPERMETSPNFDPIIEKKERKPYIPPMSHPWKHASYLAYVAIKLPV